MLTPRRWPWYRRCDNSAMVEAAAAVRLCGGRHCSRRLMSLSPATSQVQQRTEVRWGAPPRVSLTNKDRQTLPRIPKTRSSLTRMWAFLNNEDRSLLHAVCVSFCQILGKMLDEQVACREETIDSNSRITATLLDKKNPQIYAHFKKSLGGYDRTKSVYLMLTWLTEMQRVLMALRWRTRHWTVVGPCRRRVLIVAVGCADGRCSRWISLLRPRRGHRHAEAAIVGVRWRHCSCLHRWQLRPWSTGEDRKLWSWILNVDLSFLASINFPCLWKNEFQNLLLQKCEHYPPRAL